MGNEVEEAEAYEAEHVHAVYEQIASHFSSTRYKPWPIVEKYLQEMPTGSIGLDIGCGNGKYLAVNPNIFIIGSDRSTNLTKFAYQHQPHSAIVADSLFLPHPDNSFDFATSIAVVHHLSTPERRIEAVKKILKTLKPSPVSAEDNLTTKVSNCGTALIYVWALEQKKSRRGWDEGHEQDVMVPWVLQKQHPPKDKTRKKKRKDEAASLPDEQVDDKIITGLEKSIPEQPQTGQHEVYQRYYHLYKKGELESDIEKAGGIVVSSGYEKDNWWAIARRRQS